MAEAEDRMPAERKKMIAALGLGAIALLVLLRMLFFNGGSTSPARVKPAPRTSSATGAASVPDGIASPQEPAELPTPPQPVEVDFKAPQDNSDAGRNIFAFFVRPTPTPKTLGDVTAPTPTPTPPLVISSVAPSSVYAGTGEFTLEVAGDKFPPSARIIIDGQPVTTRYQNAQKLSAIVPASLIANTGTRQVILRTPDGQLYSNLSTLNVMQAPAPSYTYIGIIGIGQKHYHDRALLKNETGDLINVQLGDLVGGRFKVTAISERSVEFTDVQLGIKHELPFVASNTEGQPMVQMPNKSGFRFSPQMQQAPPQPPPEENEP